jgi:hypothetical protein
MSCQGQAADGKPLRPQIATQPVHGMGKVFQSCYVHDFVNHTKKEYARGDVHEHRAECLFSLLKPYWRVFRGISKTNLPEYVGFFQFLRNFHQLTAFEQAEMILYAALDPAVAGKARKGDFVRCLDHFKLLQSPIN